jgi:N-acetylneuraminic acid mutarotase
MVHITRISFGLVLFSILQNPSKVLAQDWNQVADYGGVARWGTIGFALDGKGYVGTGAKENGDVLASMQGYDPVSDMWFPRAAFAGGVRNYAVAATWNGKAYAGLGQSAPADWWTYDPQTNTWAQRADFPGGARVSPIAFALGQYIYVGTGIGSCITECADLWAYDPQADSWSERASLPATGRYSAVAFTINDKGYLATGSDGSNQLDDLWEYDPEADSWTARASIPGGGRYQSMAFTHQGRGYVVGGLDEQNNATTEVWAYDPTTDSWQAALEFPGQGMFQGATFVVNNEAYVVTGGFQAGSVDCWKYSEDFGTRVDRTHLTDLSVHPNPASGTAQLTAPWPVSSISCIDAVGRKVLLSQQQNGIDVAHLPCGIYTLGVEGTNGQRSTARFVKE